ncbi:hypothetical protein QWY85_14415 [Neolewinella lacunae]|uniref:AtuA-like ferredoxin-fold domain-containing protein n=1 Tax=Neolewinella lacunae TaxID=1517758 RepID=A0A923T6Z7_9BACT|nr:hypothetical protein [Neolewinella lacunae]MBC6993039.1 hypothetical protein [Neolewinella lacunae]MDN3635861.1 hypothetical protein [Neolewinella lacunae]
MKLWDIAHARTGDKGNISNISLIAYEARDYELIREKVTAESVKEWFGPQIKGAVQRFEIPQLNALNFVMYEALAGGVTRSTALDKHGKTLGAYLLEMPIE